MYFFYIQNGTVRVKKMFSKMKFNSKSHELILLLTCCVFCVLVVCLPVSFFSPWIWETGILRGSLVISNQQTLDALHTVT